MPSPQLAVQRIERTTGPGSPYRPQQDPRRRAAIGWQVSGERGRAAMGDWCSAHERAEVARKRGGFGYRPYCPVRPMSVETLPAASTTFRMVLLPLSATRRWPTPSSATPRGSLKRAAGPVQFSWTFAFRMARAACPGHRDRQPETTHDVFLAAFVSIPSMQPFRAAQELPTVEGSDAMNARSKPCLCACRSIR